MTPSSIENTAGVVVLYNPEMDLMANIASYLPDVAVLYCIDNSEEKNIALIEQLKATPKIHYVDNRGNQGLAAALNKGASLALTHGCRWLLTMDQDSQADMNMVRLMRESLSQNSGEKIAIVAPFQQDKDNQHKARMEGVQYVDAVMTSGNLLNLDAFSDVGQFRTDFFIDYLDYEYCLRLRMNGYKILQVNHAVLFHRVGAITLNNLLGMHITVSNHSPVRRYYITRNRLQVRRIYHKQFPSLLNQDRLDFLKDLIRIAIYEKDKLKKLRFILYAIKDFRSNTFGKFNR